MKRGARIALAVVVALGAWVGWAALPPPASRVEPVKPLPADFIWGVSSSAFQSEGGRVDSNIQRRNDASPQEDRYGNAVDFRHRYREDIALAKQLGINTYRMGIDWARVEPQKGKIDEAELAFYDDVILAMKQAGIAPLITLDHFVHPGWVADQGGWANPQTTADFVHYASLMAQRYHADVHHWITFNEAAFFMPAEIKMHQLDRAGALRVRDNMASAHRQVYDLIHALDAHAMVTSNIVWVGDHFGAWALRTLTNWLFLDQVEDKCDVIAIDYYSADVLEVAKVGKHWMWPPQPAGLYRALMMLKDRYPSKPVLIAETGMATENGKPRPDGIRREDVLRDSIYWTQRARDDGANVIGYMVWSLTDNFEWGSYTPRFGLYTVNALTDPQLARIPTAAVPAYQAAIRAGGMPADYRPALGQK
ncbi:MAG TPA: family 1 glycosylhydrolase [Nevskiaceae bacterium]|nr:family 1 glycosylhydrolase [Nevskiaceae bacterium]